MLDDSRQEKEERARQHAREADVLSRELRWTQGVVASELAGWQEMHARMGRRAVREFARGVVVVERGRLEGMKRVLRRLREEGGWGNSKDSDVGGGGGGEESGGKADGGGDGLAAGVGM